MSESVIVCNDRIVAGFADDVLVAGGSTVSWNDVCVSVGC